MSVTAEPQTLPVSMNPGEIPLFIVIEGIDGCGKGVQLEMLQAYMAGTGHRASDAKTAVVHDPGTTHVGLKLREMLLDGDLGMSAEVQTLLYTAARASLMRHIGDLRRKGYHVLCGRWLMSTLVYQGGVQKVGHRSVQELHDCWVKLNPDVYVVLDLPAEVARERLNARSGKPVSQDSGFHPDRDRFESKGVEFANELRQQYRLFGENMPNAWIVDADQTPDEVFADVLSACGLKSEQFSRLFGGYYEAGEP